MALPTNRSTSSSDAEHVSDHNDLHGFFNAFEGVDPADLASQADIDAAVAALVGGAPGALDTLNELAAALGDDASFAATVASSLAAKLDAAAHNTAAHDALTLSHDSLGGVSTDDHHAAAHQVTHEPGGADAMAVDAAAGTGSLRTLGAGVAQAAAGSHGHSGSYISAIGGGLETYQDHSSTGATEMIDLANGNVHRVILDTNCTLTFSGATIGKGCSFTLLVLQDATGSRLVTWPASVDWPGGAAPTLSTGVNKVDVLTFVTIDGGTTWLGFLAGSDLR